MTILVGDQVQSWTGTWNGGPTSYTYQWQKSADGSTSWSSVSGETRSEIVTDVALSGLYLRPAITATNAGGDSSVSYGQVVGPITAYVSFLVGVIPI